MLDIFLNFMSKFLRSTAYGISMAFLILAHNITTYDYIYLDKSGRAVRINQK